MTTPDQSVHSNPSLQPPPAAETAVGLQHPQSSFREPYDSGQKKGQNSRSLSSKIVVAVQSMRTETYHLPHKATTQQKRRAERRVKQKQTVNLPTHLIGICGVTSNASFLQVLCHPSVCNVSTVWRQNHWCITDDRIFACECVSCGVLKVPGLV